MFVQYPWTRLYVVLGSGTKKILIIFSWNEDSFSFMHLNFNSLGFDYLSTFEKLEWLIFRDLHLLNMVSYRKHSLRDGIISNSADSALGKSASFLKNSFQAWLGKVLKG